MKILYKLFIIAFLMISIIPQSTFASNGAITLQLAEKMNTVEKSELIKINITLTEQYNSQELISQVKSLKPKERRSYVISVLKEFSENAQKDILSNLNLLEKTSQVSEIKAFWIANIINCYATPEAIQQLSYMYEIASIDYDEYRIMIDPSESKGGFYVEGDPQSKEITWNVLKINADDVWALGFTGEGIIVSVLDTGVNYNHNDLSDHVWESTEYPNHGYDFANNDNNPMDDHGHGTHCAGTVAGDGTAGSQTGMAPDAIIMCCKVMDAGGGGTESGVWEAVEFSIDHGAHVLSLSLGWLHAWNPNRIGWRQTFDNALAAGVVSSVAAGNEGADQGSYPVPDNVRTPGDCPPPWLHPDQSLSGGVSGVICVGSTTSSDNVSDFSGRGPVTWESISSFNDYPYQPEIGLIRPDIAAPGSNIKSLDYGSNTGYASGWNGTSMATPANAGMMALILQKNNMLSPEDIGQIVEETAFVLSPGKNNNSGSGRIDALAAVEATSMPGPSYHAHNINDAAGNNNGQLEPGESILLDLTMGNFSDEIANDVTVELSTESEHIIITDNTEYFGNFSLEDIIEKTDAFAFDVANNIPGGEEIKFIITAYNTDNSWQSNFIEMAYGVNLQTGNITIVDTEGNNNGSLDPGETVFIEIETINNGQLDALLTMATLASPSSVITVNSGSFDFGSLEAGETATGTFNISVSPNAAVGSSVELNYEVVSGYYTLESDFFPKVGLIVEDFESGDFSMYDWEFSGNQPWTVVNNESYEGVYSAKSGSISNNQSSGLKLTIDVANNDSIAFYRQVSSESTYDFLEFYIDNSKVGDWSGEKAWTRFAYAVTEGVHTFKWVYVKDQSVANGSDCGWIDFIELPVMVDEAMTVNAGENATICEGDNFTTDAVAQNYNSLLWTTSGTGTFNNSADLDAEYTPSADDYNDGMVVLSITVYGNEGAEIEDEVELSFNHIPETPEAILGAVEVCAGFEDEYEVAEIEVADSYNWNLIPAEAGVISANGNNVSVTWADDFAGNAELKVNGENDCGVGEFSEILNIIVSVCVGVDELINNEFSINPNPSNGHFTITFSEIPSDNYSVLVMNVAGKTIYKRNNISSEQLLVELDNVDEGMYFLIIREAASQIVQKIIIY